MPNFVSIGLSFIDSDSVKGQLFFLDEGFGSLDQSSLDMVISTLQTLHLEKMTIGIISHVAELQQRMPWRLIVEPAKPAGKGSQVWIEIA